MALKRLRRFSARTPQAVVDSRSQALFRNRLGQNPGKAPGVQFVEGFKEPGRGFNKIAGFGKRRQFGQWASGTGFLIPSD